MLRTLMQDRLQERYDRRAAENAKAIAAREEEGAKRRSAIELMGKAATGEADPDGVSQMLAALGIADVDPSQVPQPAPRRRMEKLVGEGIDKATSPEMIDTDEAIAGKARTAGVALPEFAYEGMEATSAETPDPYEHVGSLGREFGERAGAKRRSLMAKPTEKVDVLTADGSQQTQFVSPYAGTVQSKPSAAQQGVIKGTEKISELETSGDALADQVEREAQARQNVELSPEAQNARVREAVNKEIATLKATLPMQLQIATEKAKIELANAVNKENAVNFASGARAAQNLGPFFDRVAELTKSLNTEESGLMARAQGATLTGLSYAGYAPKVQELEQLIAQNSRQLAIAMGVREANVSEKETAQAMKGIGLSQWSTVAERRNALRNLQDLITLSPAIAARVPSNAGIGERVSLAQQFMRQRRSAEQEAIKAGAASYLDPVTGGITAVIQ